MTKTEYFPISPICGHPSEMEVFGSLLCRMAAAHSVSLFAFAAHLRNWWRLQHPDDCREFKNVVNGANPTLCGTGSNVATLVEILEKGTACPIIGRTTFQSLATVVSPFGHGLCRRGRAWCPSCLEEAIVSQSPFYDRLIWAIPLVSRCRIHRVGLVSHCPHCDAFQSHYHHLGDTELCYRCKKTLREAPSRWKPLLAPTQYERECHQLVEAVATGAMQSIVPDAYGVFLAKIVDGVVHFRTTLGKASQISLSISKYAARDNGRPRFATFLRRCALLEVNPADVARDPIGTADSVNLLDFLQVDGPADTKPRRPEHLVALAEQRLNKGLANSDIDSLPSLAQIARELGVSKGFLNYQLPDLCARYGRHRSRCGKERHLEQIRAATEYLLEGPIHSYPSPRYRSHDHLVAAAVRETGVGVRVARLAVESALKKTMCQGAYRRYRKANGLYRPTGPRSVQLEKGDV